MPATTRLKLNGKLCEPGASLSLSRIKQTAKVKLAQYQSVPLRRAEHKRRKPPRNSYRLNVCNCAIAKCGLLSTYTVWGSCNFVFRMEYVATANTHTHSLCEVSTSNALNWLTPSPQTSPAPPIIHIFKWYSLFFSAPHHHQDSAAIVFFFLYVLCELRQTPHIYICGGGWIVRAYISAHSQID